MANGAFKFKDNLGNVVASLSNNGSNIVITGGTLDLSGMTGLTMGSITMSGTTENATSASHAASYLLTSSFNSYTGTTDTIIGTLQTSSGSVNTFTSSATSRLNSIEGVSGSYATTGSNQFKSDQTITGSLTVTGTITAQEFYTQYVSASILYKSGSTKFGDTNDDVMSVTGSLNVTGSITSTGNVGVGSTTANYPLDLYSATSATTSTILRLKNGYNDASTGLRVRWDFQSLPGVYLDVITDSGGSKSVYLSLSSANAAPTQVFQIVGSTGAATFSNTITSQTNGSTFGNASVSGRAVIIQGGSANQVIQFKNAAGGDATLYVEGTSAAAHYRFDTYSTSNVLYIANGGNVGLGTNNPSAQGLTIFQGGGDRRVMLELNRNNTPGLQSAIQFTVGSSVLVGQIQHEYVASNQNHMSFTLRNSGGSNFVSLWLQNDGNVGIGNSSPTNKLHVSGNIYSTDTVFGRNIKPEAWASITAGTPSGAGIPMGYSMVTINSPCDGTWRTILTNMNDTKMHFWASIGDAASKDTAQYFFMTTSPAYGVSNMGNVNYQDNGWNTGGFDFRYINGGSGTYHLQVSCTSYYSSSNTAYGNIYFLRIE